MNPQELTVEEKAVLFRIPPEDKQTTEELISLLSPLGGIIINLTMGDQNPEERALTLGRGLSGKALDLARPFAAKFPPQTAPLIIAYVNMVYYCSIISTKMPLTLMKDLREMIFQETKR